MYLEWYKISNLKSPLEKCHSKFFHCSALSILAVSSVCLGSVQCRGVRQGGPNKEMDTKTSLLTSQYLSGNMATKIHQKL